MMKGPSSLTNKELLTLKQKSLSIMRQYGGSTGESGNETLDFMYDMEKERYNMIVSELKLRGL